MWCFDVDAKFERNGVTSSNTLKCVSRPFRPSDDDARRASAVAANRSFENLRDASRRRRASRRRSFPSRRTRAIPRVSRAHDVVARPPAPRRDIPHPGARSSAASKREKVLKE